MESVIIFRTTVFISKGVILTTASLALIRIISVTLFIFSFAVAPQSTVLPKGALETVVEEPIGSKEDLKKDIHHTENEKKTVEQPEASTTKADDATNKKKKKKPKKKNKVHTAPTLEGAPPEDVTDEIPSMTQEQPVR